MKIHPYVSAVVVAIIFGFSYMFTKDGLNYVTPNQLMSFRFILAALVMTVLWLLGLIKINLRGRPLRGILVLALIEPVLYFFLETSGVNLTTSSEGGLFIALIPIVVTILGAIFLKERPNRWQTLFIISSVSGIFLIVFLGQKVTTSGHFVGYLALLGAVIAGAIFNILSRRLSLQFKPVEITFVMMWLGAIVFTGAMLIEGFKAGQRIDYLNLLRIKELWIPLLYLGVISSVIAFFGSNYTLSKIEASRSSAFANLSTIVSVVAGVCFRGEPLLWSHFVGGFLILLGVWGINRFRTISPSETKAI